MKKMTKILMFFLLIANSCNLDIWTDKSYPVYIVNNADHSIGCYFSLNGEYGTLYPDTALPETNKYIITEIKSGSRYIYDSGIEWKEIYSILPEDTMSVYIFHTDTLKQYSWEEIKNGYKILKRYDLSLEDLIQNNWTITFP